MRLLLIASGAVLLVLGAAEAWSHRRPGGADERSELPEPEDHTDNGHGHGHDHDHDLSTAPRVAWPLFLPVLE
ncbi:hypothetical protein [Streptomyces avermitilis]|uniref:hypothetical protein n=1 Tax=Streptomyces avermitilis TaxID=33903 RepID=UPI003829DBB3